MDKKTERCALFVRCISAMILSFAIIYEANLVLELDIPLYFMIIAVIAALALILAGDKLKREPAFWITLASLALAAALLPLIFGEKLRALYSQGFTWVRDSFRWMRAYSSGSEAAQGQELDIYRCIFLY